MMIASLAVLTMDALISTGPVVRARETRQLPHRGKFRWVSPGKSPQGCSAINGRQLTTEPPGFSRSNARRQPATSSVDGGQNSGE